MKRMLSRNPEVVAVEVTGVESLEGFPGITSVQVHACDAGATCRLITATSNVRGYGDPLLLMIGEVLVYLPDTNRYDYYESWDLLIEDYDPEEVDTPLEFPNQLAFEGSESWGT